MCVPHTSVVRRRTSRPRRSIARVIPIPPELPVTTILKVRPGHVVAMHAHPGGKLLFRVLPQTVYGRRLILSVTRRRGAWAAVPTFLVPNGRRAWVRVSRRTFVVRRTRWRLSADLSSRTVTVLHGAERVRRLHVTIGAPATPTPPGTYAVTDKLEGPAVRQLLRLLHPRALRPPAEDPHRLRRRAPGDPRHRPARPRRRPRVAGLPARARPRRALAHAHGPGRHAAHDPAMSASVLST